jgi:beta-lactamase regulating signal transducer with metallopeptidase domain
VFQWIFYVLVISVVISISAVFAEQALRRRHLPTRMVWLIALSGCVWLSILALTVSSASVTTSSYEQQATSSVRAVVPIRLPDVAHAGTIVVRTDGLVTVDAVLRTLWVIASALVLVGLIASAVQVYLRRRRWPIQMLHSHCVGISKDVGPAVIGLLRPTIVLPEWVLTRSPTEQQLIVAHEASHLRARDPMSLTVAVIAVLLLPWNPLLWWQLRRLRHAIEVDCDARVLKAGHNLTTYGATLIEVGQRRGRYLGTVAAMSENRTLLEERIEVMSQRTNKPWKLGFVALFALSVSVALAATQVTSPGKPAIAELKLDTTTLDRYVGHYQMEPTRILTITREGEQLFAHGPGDPPIPIYADSQNEFHWKVISASVTFSGNANGLAATATIHQNGAEIVSPRVDDAAAAQVEERFTARIKAQQPQAGGETALRKTLAALTSGSPNYGDMEEPLQKLVRQGMPAMGVFFAKLGPVQTVEFKGISDEGADKYLVTHQSGQSQWLIRLAGDGRIAGIMALPVF